MPHRPWRCSLTLGMLVLLVACGADDGDPSAEESGGATIVATTTIVGDIVANLVGDCATVDVLIGPGVDPHEFEPSARQAAELRAADVVVASGLGLEETLGPVLESAADDGVPVLHLSDGVETIPFGDAAPEAGSPDPHIWHDPGRVAPAAVVLGDGLAEALRCDAEDIPARAARYGDRLRDLDEQLETQFATIPAERRKLVTNHDAFGYLADRYDFEVIGTVIPSGTTLAEPSSAELAELVELVRAEEVPAVFAETTQSAALADALADELGEDVEVVELYSDSLGEPDSAAATYVELLQTNATRIADALGG